MLPYPPGAAQAFHDSGNNTRVEAQAVHAGIDLEPDIQWSSRACLFEEADLSGVVNDDIDAVALGEAGLIRVEESFQQHDAPVEPGFTQGDRLIHGHDTEGMGSGKNPRGIDQSVAIGMRLDDGHDPAGRGALSDAFEIMLEGWQVDARPHRARHPNSPPLYTSSA